MKRTLTPEEWELWRYVTRHDQPLHPDRESPAADIPAAPKKSPPQVKLWHQGMHKSLAAAEQMPPAMPVCGAYAGIDRNTAEKFRKGNYPLDAALDLHGFSREKAHKSLMDFIHRQHEAGSRCLLVITGKGKQTGKETGILREAVPRWLAEPGLKPLVLALDVAKPKHGGTGAYYILLRRKR